MLSSEFLSKFKRATEAKWRDHGISPSVYGFQFQRGTRWNPGLSHQQIAEYEGLLGARFPFDFRAFLGAMNGTDLPTLNVYGSCGEPQRESVGVYSYPKDLCHVQDRIEEVLGCRTKLKSSMANQGFELSDEAALVPIYAHRYLVCTPSLETTAVLSIRDGDDAIIYGDSFEEYLRREFLEQ